jgi:hypothetical protein
VICASIFAASASAIAAVGSGAIETADAEGDAAAEDTAAVADGADEADGADIAGDDVPVLVHAASTIAAVARDAISGVDLRTTTSCVSPAQTLRPDRPHRTLVRPYGGAMSGPVRAALGLLCGALALTGCQSQSGPEALETGQYVALASSTGVTPAGARLAVTATEVALQSDSKAQTAAFAGASEEFLLCPPGGHGAGTLLQEPLTIDGRAYAEPMVFGDCGTTRPARVTLVDLTSRQDPAENTSFPFSRWTEFCRVGSPDCPSS